MKWTQELDDILRQSYHTMTYKEMSNKMGIPYKSIQCRAGVLKLGKKSTTKVLSVGDIINDWRITSINKRDATVVSLDGLQNRKFRLTSLRQETIAPPDKIMKYRTYNKEISSHKLYIVWQTVKSKCKKYNIELEQDWLDYNIFYKDNITIYEDKLCFSRIDMSKGFVRNNCCYSPKSEIAAKNGSKSKGIKTGPKSESVKEKTRQSCLAKYGTVSPLGNKDIQNKARQTLLDKYGVEHSSKIPSVQETRKENSIVKYGVNHHTKTEEFRNKAKQRAIDSGLTYIYDGKTSEEIAKEMGISLSGFHQRVRKYGYDSAVKMEKTKSDIENVMEELLKKIGVNYLVGQRVDKYFPDFVLPDQKIIIECDGLYWHSDAINKNRHYHRDKSKVYEQNGYRSLFFREDEIYGKLPIIESMISHRCKKSNVIYARKCTIEELSHKNVKEFVSNNHLMGNGSGRGVVLKYNNDIVAVAQIVQRDYIDISRFCTKLFTHINGGFSKILSYLSQYNKPIQTFIDGRYGDGSYLVNLGFELISNHISFKWVKNNRSFHRLSHRGNTGYNKGLYKIWDCGQYKYVKNPTK